MIRRPPNRSQLPGCLRLLLAATLLAVLLSTSFSKAQDSALLPGAKPPDIPAAWKSWIGEYGVLRNGSVNGPTYALSEKDGAIWILQPQWKGDAVSYKVVENLPLAQAPPTDAARGAGFHFGTSEGLPTLQLDGVANTKMTPEFDARVQVLIKPVRPVAELRSQALVASPPVEKGPFRKPELVELARLDPAVHLDIRYATSNDFLGTAVYTQARAFLQRPAAEALLRALNQLKRLGYGLLIHDAYRPWYVTKIFWDATPPEGKIFVADPAQGSRHNRGCAVDLTLYDLASGKPVEMPGTYDEMSPRSFPDYPGGTSLQRWHRDLLRRAMEDRGFTVYEHEWWHFDYKDWREYPILNIKFEELSPSQGLASSH